MKTFAFYGMLLMASGQLILHFWVFFFVVDSVTFTFSKLETDLQSHTPRYLSVLEGTVS